MSLSPAQIQALTPAQLDAILDSPVVAPPNGEQPNFVNPANWDVVIILESTLCYTIPTIAVAIRCYTKKFLIRKLYFEDYLLMLGWVVFIGETVIADLLFVHGHGVHQWNLPLRVFQRELYWANIFMVTYDPANLCVKLSILFFYLRVFVPEKKGRMGTYLGIVIAITANILMYFIHFWISLFMCTPREKIWNQLYTGGGHCFDENALITSLGIYNAVADFVVLVLPIYSVCKLNMPLRRKLGIFAIFATGFLGCLTSIARTIYTFKVFGSNDFSWNITAVGCWGEAEIAIGLICASLPSFPTFFRTMKGNITRKLLPSSHGTSSSGSKKSKPSNFSMLSIARRKGNVPKNPWYDDSALRTWQELDGDGAVELVDMKPEVIVEEEEPESKSESESKSKSKTVVESSNV